MPAQTVELVKIIATPGQPGYFDAVFTDTTFTFTVAEMTTYVETGQNADLAYRAMLGWVLNREPTLNTPGVGNGKTCTVDLLAQTPIYIR